MRQLPDEEEVGDGGREDGLEEQVVVVVVSNRMGLMVVMVGWEEPGGAPGWFVVVDWVVGGDGVGGDLL